LDYYKDGSSKLRNIGIYVPIYMVSYIRILKSLSFVHNSVKCIVLFSVMTISVCMFVGCNDVMFYCTRDSEYVFAIPMPNSKVVMK
jgi:hypothetical protein